MFVTIVSMDEQSKARLEAILGSNPEDLIQDDIDFLNGRRWALNNEQRRVFASVLIQDDGQAPVNPEPTQPVTPHDLPPAGTTFTDPSQPTTTNEAPADPNPVNTQEVTPVVEQPNIDSAAQPAAEVVNEEPVQPVVEALPQQENVQPSNDNPYDADPNQFDPDVNQQ